jgi:phage/plasmid-associated DNA primase
MPTLIEFANGVYDLGTDLFSHDLSAPGTRLSVLEVEFNEDCTCEDFDNIIHHQFEDTEARDWLLALMGRCLHSTGMEGEHWDVIPVLVGVAGSGKSTLIHVLMSFFRERDTVLLADASSSLRSSGGSKCWAILEIKPDQPPLEMLRALFTGKSFNSIQENSRGIVAGSIIPESWMTDANIAQRVVRFAFDKEVDDRCSDLLHQIRAQELPAVLRRINSAYLKKVKELDGAGISRKEF